MDPIGHKDQVYTGMFKEHILALYHFLYALYYCIIIQELRINLPIYNQDNERNYKIIIHVHCIVHMTVHSITIFMMHDLKSSILPRYVDIYLINMCYHKWLIL